MKSTTRRSKNVARCAADLCPVRIVSTDGTVKLSIASFLRIRAMMPPMSLADRSPSTSLSIVVNTTSCVRFNAHRNALCSTVAAAPSQTHICSAIALCGRPANCGPTAAELFGIVPTDPRIITTPAQAATTWLGPECPIPGQDGQRAAASSCGNVYMPYSDVHSSTESCKALSHYPLVSVHSVLQRALRVRVRNVDLCVKSVDSDNVTRMTSVLGVTTVIS